VLPAHERLARAGISFESHQINSCVCMPSRSVLYTGRHIQQTKMFDNTNFPCISSMSWRAQHNNYLNCLRDVDRNIVPLLDELERLTRRTS
jgi:arylsulfatase A-like enzyme